MITGAEALDERLEKIGIVVEGGFDGLEAGVGGAGGLRSGLGPAADNEDEQCQGISDDIDERMCDGEGDGLGAQINSDRTFVIQSLFPFPIAMPHAMPELQ